MIASVSIALFVAFVGGLLLIRRYFPPGDPNDPRAEPPPNWVAYTRLGLAFGVGLSLIGFGDWLPEAVGSILGPFGVGLAIVATFVIVPGDLLINPKGKGITVKWAMVCLLALPILFHSGQGPLAEAGQGVTNAIYEGGQEVSTSFLTGGDE